MLIEKISTKKVSDTISEQIEKMILDSSFPGGEKLPSVRELCEMFGAGRSAVRDAITVLKGKGLVIVKQGEGTYVSKFDSRKIFSHAVMLPNAKDITELFQVRKIVETGMAEMAACNRSENDLKRMKMILSTHTDAPWEDDYQFHLSIAKATGNALLIQFVQVISTTIKHAMIDFHQFIKRDTEALETIAEHHERIFESISSGTPNQSNEYMLQHLTFVESILHKSLKQNS
ncbi:FadR/GntR family transcriptional regulator [Peribacillus frigoritolerans]|uniref:FadR/GntR family transcriptional regulator n=1 Tax=Peribacillus frigoritolerans TaxID=450367 RepID=UPI001059935A|nr:FadR/GntR family transcriptional regulator [Peribacillus frigoritolerans]TDL83096.1 FadR family transcriptional regulator [Peribacillus frigoritolerans]